jgi:hypothetical protein
MIINMIGLPSKEPTEINKLNMQQSLRRLKYIETKQKQPISKPDRHLTPRIERIK